MRWEIRANLGRHVRADDDARGWLWEIGRGNEVARIVVEIDEAAWSRDPVSLAEDTRHALETDGRSELLKVLDENEPPGVIRCSADGCTYGSAADASTRT